MSIDPMTTSQKCMVRAQRTDCTAAADEPDERTYSKSMKKYTNEADKRRKHLSLVKLDVKLLSAFLPFY